MPLNYNNNTPQASQVQSQTQAPILENFQSIDTTFNNTNTGGNFTQMLLQNVATALSGGTLPADPKSIYHAVNGANDPAFNGHPLPFFANSQGDFPLLPDVKISGNNAGFKIGNVIFNFGQVASTNAGVAVTFAFPMNTHQFALTLGTTANTTTWHTAFNSTGANIFSGVNTTTFYLAVGQ